MIAGNTLSDFIRFFSASDFQKNDKIVYNYFKEKYDKNS